MQCQECHANTATIHFTKIINGQKTEMHLCEACAKEKEGVFAGTNGFSMNSLLSGLLNLDFPIGDTHPNGFPNIQHQECNVCNMTYQKFSKTGKFGCANCYQTFSSKIDPILRRVHSGNTSHHGKIPKRIGGDLHIRKEIEELKLELQKSILNEEFEQAANYRDRIKELERNMVDNGEEGI